MPCDGLVWTLEQNRPLVESWWHLRSVWSSVVVVCRVELFILTEVLWQHKVAAATTLQQLSLLSLQLFCKCKIIPKPKVYETVFSWNLSTCIYKIVVSEKEQIGKVKAHSLPSSSLGLGRRIPSTDTNPPCGGKGFKLRRQPSEPKRSCCWLGLGLSDSMMK